MYIHTLNKTYTTKTYIQKRNMHYTPLLTLRGPVEIFMKRMSITTFTCVNLDCSPSLTSDHVNLSFSINWVSSNHLDTSRHLLILGWTYSVGFLSSWSTLLPDHHDFWTHFHLRSLLLIFCVSGYPSLLCDWESRSLWSCGILTQGVVKILGFIRVTLTLSKQRTTSRSITEL